MKIGILTLPIAENYGGTLQAIALYRLLHKQGHDVILIYKETHQVLWKKLLKEILLKIPFHDFNKIKTNNKKNQARLKRKKFHRSFIEKQIFKISKDLYTKRDLEEYSKKENFDAVIVGSDQVWRKEYINEEYYKSYFLDFLNGEKTKKIAYAASFGKDCWEGQNDIEEISKLLKDFNAISTREESGINICKNTFICNNVKHVLDPTLLLNKEFYLNEIISKHDLTNIIKGGLVTYVLDEVKEKREIINYVENNSEIQNISHLKGFNLSNTLYSLPEWIASFAYADIIVTDSFHGMVFSIIFEKNFLVIGNKDRGIDRFISLLNLLGLKERLIFNLEDLKNKNIENIDYKVVNEILNKNKKLSLDFLLNALDNRNL